MNGWNEPRVWVSIALIALFGYAFAHNPADEAMKGALITGFAAAYGYWLGSSKGATVAQEQVTAALRVASNSTDGDGSRPTGQPDDPVTVVDAGKTKN